MKPRMTQHSGIWMCSTRDHIGFGRTMQAAYDDWLACSWGALRIIAGAIGLIDPIPDD